MKNNLILGAIATVFAVGSAFATLAPETAYVRAKLTSTQANFTCQQTSVACDLIGSLACNVEVNTTINGGTKIVNGRRQSTNCTPVLTNSTSTAIVAPDTFYDVQ